MSRLRKLAWPLVPVYGAVLALKDALRATGALPSRSLGWPVISIGSISAGGAGKTPVVIALARLLTSRGWQVDVLSRGYRRTGRGVQQVIPEHDGAAREYGDEPVLIALRAEVPVWVHASRILAGRRAEATDLDSPPEPAGGVGREGKGPAEAEDAPLRAHLLDDGFQHRRLARHFDLLVVTAEDLRDTLLPAGNLREPLHALKRAGAFAVREEELNEVTERLRKLGNGDIPVWTLRRSLHFPPPLGIFAAGLRPLAFCGIARPEGFAASLAEAGCGIVDTVIFPDHHGYTDDDMLLLLRVARSYSATGFVTTEKDAVKLSAAMQSRLRAELGPLMVVRLDVHFVYESPVARSLEQRLRPVRDLPTQIESRTR